jgi:hypothetical protein
MITVETNITTYTVAATELLVKLALLVASLTSIALAARRLAGLNVTLQFPILSYPRGRMILIGFLNAIVGNSMEVIFQAAFH